MEIKYKVRRGNVSANEGKGGKKERERKRGGRRKSALFPGRSLVLFSRCFLRSPLASPAEVTLTGRNVLPVLCQEGTEGRGGGGEGNF